MWLLVFSSRFLCFWNITPLMPHKLSFYWHRFYDYYSMVGKIYFEFQSRTQEVPSWQSIKISGFPGAKSPEKGEELGRGGGQRLSAWEDSSHQGWVPSNPCFDSGWLSPWLWLWFSDSILAIHSYPHPPSVHLTWLVLRVHAVLHEGSFSGRTMTHDCLLVSTPDSSPLPV